jgi:hypothetical protein
VTDQPFPCFMCKSAGSCDRCRRLRAIGHLVVAVIYARIVSMTKAVKMPIALLDNPAIDHTWAVYLRNLDAIAELMIDRGRLVRRHRKEMNEEAREAQRDARDAYAEGRAEGREERGDW